MAMTLNDAAAFLRENDEFIILTHCRPDGDTIGSAAGLCLGLRSAGKRAYVAHNPEVVGRFERIVGHLTPPGDFSPKKILSVDIASASLFPKNVKQLSENVDLSIDHHPNSESFAKNQLTDINCAATGELIAILLDEMDIKLTPEIASALYIAVITDTGGFRFENTTSRTLRVAADLIDAGINAAAITGEYFGSKTPSRFALESELLHDIEYNGKIALVFLTIEKMLNTKATYDDMDGISSLVKAIIGVEIGITLREEEDMSVKISVRTSSNYAANAICSKLGGGGHARAGGCLIKGSIAQARVKIFNAIYDIYPELK
jgi:phosphoesterase RecJ-like protein